MSYEIFDHTADLGLRIRAASLHGLLEEAGIALFCAIVENFDVIEPKQRVTLELPGDEHDELLRDWLAELLYIFHVERLVFCQFRVSVNEKGLRATAWGEPLDLTRHHLDMELKAVTYHGLKVEHHDNGWLAEVIVDL